MKFKLFIVFLIYLNSSSLYSQEVDEASVEAEVKRRFEKMIPKTNGIYAKVDKETALQYKKVIDERNAILSVEERKKILLGPIESALKMSQERGLSNAAAQLLQLRNSLQKDISIAEEKARLHIEKIKKEDAERKTDEQEEAEDRKK